MENRNLNYMLEAVVDDLLDGLVEVDTLTVTEILDEAGFLDEVPMEEWGELIEIIADRVRVELREIHDGWRVGVI